MTVKSKVHDALREAAIANVCVSAVVLGSEQWRCHLQESGAGEPPGLGLTVLHNPKVAGPMVVADDVRHSLQATGLFTVILPGFTGDTPERWANRKIVEI